MVTKVHSVKECIECASQNIVIDIDDNEVICKDCGCIFEPLLPKEESQLERVRGFGFTKHRIVQGLFGRKKAAPAKRKTAKRKTTKKKTTAKKKTVKRKTTKKKAAKRKTVKKSTGKKKTARRGAKRTAKKSKRSRK